MGDVWRAVKLVDDDALGPEELGTPVDEVDLRGVLGEEDGAFGRGVAPADHGHDVVLVEGCVTDGAERDAFAGPLLLVGKAKFAAFTANREDDGLGLIGSAVLGLDLVAALDPDDLSHLVVYDGHVVFHDLVSEVHHEIEAVDVDVSGVVLDGSPDGGLAPKSLADDDWLGLVPGCVEGGGEPSGSLSRDHDVILALGCRQFSASGGNGAMCLCYRMGGGGRIRRLYRSIVSA